MSSSARYGRPARVVKRRLRATAKTPSIVRSSANSEILARAFPPPGRCGVDAWESATLTTLSLRSATDDIPRFHAHSVASPLWPASSPFAPFASTRTWPGRSTTLVAPPHDVVTPELRDELLAASPHNVIRLARPSDPEEAGASIREWQDEGVLVREAEPAVWILEETFEGPDGERRTRRGLVARLRVGPYGESGVYPHERTFTPAEAPAARPAADACAPSSRRCCSSTTAPSPAETSGEPDIEAEFEGVRSRLWRVDDPAAIEQALAAIEAPFVIADGHHRYETALRFHEEDGTEETAYILAALVSRDRSRPRDLPDAPHDRRSGSRSERVRAHRRRAARGRSRAAGRASARPARVRPGHGATVPGLPRESPPRERSTPLRSTSSGSRACATRPTRPMRSRRCAPARPRPRSSSARRRSTRWRSSRAPARSCRRRARTSSPS